jgi:glyoxylate/hydroxypyruvate reductase A
VSLYLCGRLDEAEREHWRACLQQALPEESILTVLDAQTREQVDVAVVANPAPGSLQGLPQLRLIQSLWAGVDRLLSDASLPEDIPLARMVDPAMNQAMAETALWAVLSLQRGFFEYARQQQQACWRVLPQRRADELHVSVLGLGQMGAATATRLAEQGYRVHAWRTRDTGAIPGLPASVVVHAGAQALPALAARSEILINLLPLTAATRGLLNAELLAALPAGAALVNLARGAHLVESDLIAALDSGHISQAVLDVFAVEPLPGQHPFWRHPRVSLLPHAAAQTDPRSAAAVVAANVRRLRQDQPLRHLVDRRRGY